jgi:hypothetical protein
MVLYVYNRKLRKGTIRWFVQALAVFDLLSCMVAIPGEIIDMMNNYTFGLSPMCKVTRQKKERKKERKKEKERKNG